ncbi:MAG: SCO family protein [Calditrichaeota bacterium]|nr:MAG: SCO family protein [Calditrichota bacterium]MBL1206626.1 SCO family protein [Calditrichota bacterium]NOG46453.1 SCO family protein [Calditrichota bacterium]
MRLLIIFLLVSFGLLFSQQVRDDVEELKKINVFEKSGSFIPLDVPLTTEQGDTVSLTDYFNSEVPVLFTFAYYDCPMLCSQVLTAVSASVKKLDWESDNRYKVITISIDPDETPELARKKKKFYLAEISDPEIKKNWTFFTASQEAIDTLTEAFGFEYYYVEERDEYAHPAVAFVLSPEGKISRYLYGLNYEPKDLKFALLEASEGRVGSALEKLLLYCYHYDATANTYTPFAKNIMRLGGVITLLILGSFLSIYWIRENKKHKVLV